MLGSEKDRQESSLGPCFLSSCQIKQVTLRLENTVQKIAGVYGSSLTILDGVGINLFDSIFFFFSFFFSSYRWVILFLLQLYSHLFLNRNVCFYTWELRLFVEDEL